jgi:hypothetical protein
MEEEYFKIFYGRYEISNHGKVRRLKNNGTYFYLTQNRLNRGGYVGVYIYKKHYMVHTLVAYVFIGKRPEGLVLDHVDRCRTNNLASNLRYVSYSENIKNRNSTFFNDIPVKEGQNREDVYNTYLQKKKK